MATRTQELKLYQGDDFNAHVNVYNDLDGSAFDLTGSTPLCQIRTDVADNAPLVIATITTALSLPNTITLALSHTITVTLTTVEYVWDLQITQPGGQITTLLKGPVFVTLEVTR